MIYNTKTFSNIRDSIVFVWFFLLTLSSFYFFSLGMPLFSVIGALISIPLIMLYKANWRKYQKLPLILVLSVLFISIFTALPNMQFIHMKRIFLVLILIPLVYFSAYVINERPKLMLNVIRITLTIHVVILIFQFAYYYLFGTFIDFIEPVTGVGQRSLGGSNEFGESGVKIIRAAGLYSEPGTYSTNIIIQLLMKKYLELRTTGKDKLNKLDLIVVLSTYISFSLFGFIFASLFLIKYLVKENAQTKAISIIATVPIIYFVYKYYVSLRFARDIDDSGIGFRQEAVKFYLNDIMDNPFQLMFGYSNYVDLNAMLNVNFAWNDVGMIFTILISFGLVGLAALFFITKPRIKGKVLLATILFLSKLSITTLFVWFCFALIYSDNKSNRNKTRRIPYHKIIYK